MNIIWFDDEAAVLSDGYTHWVERHRTMVELHIRTTAERKYGSDDQLRARMHNHPKITYNVLQDRYRYSNEEKLEMALDELLTGSKIIIIVGDRGEGKSVLAWQLADIGFKRYGRKVYTSYVDEVPPIAELIDSPTDCPENGLYLMDEAHITGIHARKGNTNQSLAILNQLSTLRHGNRTFIIITQDASFIDKNAKNLYNVVLCKQFPVNASNNMKDLIFEGYDIMLPKKKTRTYYQSRNHKFNIKFGIPEWWSSKWSESFSLLSDPEVAKKIILQMGSSDARPPAIKTYLNGRGFKIENEEIKQILYDHSQTVLNRIKRNDPDNQISMGDAEREVERLFGGSCETVNEVVQEMKELGYEVKRSWIQDQILKIKMNIITTQQVAVRTS